MTDLSERLDQMEIAIKKPSFRQSLGRANEVNYWIFDYPPERELEVRERIAYMKRKNRKEIDGFELVVYDLYDMIIDFLESKNFLEKCFDFEKKRGLERISKAVTNSMKINEDDSLMVQYIKEHTPKEAVVFLTGIGKCYPILRSHKVLNNLHQAFVRVPVVMFFPGTYNEQELILFNEIKDDNYYRAFRLVNDGGKKMLIKDMFRKKIDREIQGVIIVGQGEDTNVSQELEEYVVTRELQKHFADFFSAYKKGIVGQTPKMGVWISGFFGSGKSHFLRFCLIFWRING